MASESLGKFEDFKEQCKKEAEAIVKETFPVKVLELHKLLESDKFSPDRIYSIEEGINIPVPQPIVLNNDSHQDTVEQVNPKKRKLDAVVNDGLPQIAGSKVLALPNGLVKSNTQLLELIKIVKPEIRQLIINANKIKMWITYLIPRIEDGNNFGVSIQEDTLAEARQVESEAATYLDQISRYFITRGKIMSKVAKYPHVEDYRCTVHELDEKEFVSLRLVVCELRNHYASLHDIIMKNVDKIRKPRTANTDNMY